jgi:hypothetical protein
MQNVSVTIFFLDYKNVFGKGTFTVSGGKVVLGGVYYIRVWKQ